MPPSRPCSVPGCDLPYHCKRLCVVHFPSKFFDLVEITETCWLWLGGKTRAGYGSLWVDGASSTAHRWSFEFHTGEKVPGDQEIDHMCGVVGCVNPDHLEVVTHQENVRRFNDLRTHCLRGHEFTELNTRRYVSKDGRHQRFCRACDRLRARKYRSEKP